MNESSGFQPNPLTQPAQESEGANPSESSQESTDLTALQNQVKELESQLKEKDGKYFYLYADFENFKKRSVKERSELIKFGWESVARDLLQTADNLERAIAHVPPGIDANFMNGLKMVLDQFRSSLQKQGVEVIESIEKPFDPNFHEAVGQEPSHLPTGVITQEHSRGYTLHGRLLRPARVVLSAGGIASQPGTENRG